MSVKAGWSTPMLHVQSIEKSIRFYDRLGFDLIDTDRCVPIGWARMHCEGGALMFLRAELPAGHNPMPVMIVMYTPDLPALREQLQGQGVNTPPIKHPEYTPSGELGLRDPDGNFVNVIHWSDVEHSEWLERTKEKPPFPR